MFNIFFACLITFISTSAFSWGPRGHMVVARVAAKLLEQKELNNQKILPVFKSKQYLMAHLANIPDSYWRSSMVSKEVNASNGTTHYIGLNKISPMPQFNSFPFAIADAHKNMLNQKKWITDLGTAPWRVQQLYKNALDTFKALHQTKKNDRKKREKLIDLAVLNLGIVSHFIGDLAQPLHTNTDYDGWQRKQGGLHKYFEHRVVDEFDMDLMKKVLNYALQEKPSQPVILNTLKRHKKAQNGLNIAVALAFDSYSHVDELFDLDKKYSLVSPSRREGILKTPALRKDPQAIKKHFEDFAIKRLALGADVLSDLWLLAWRQAGKPDMSDYKNYYFEHRPEFIKPDYLPQMHKSKS